MKAKQVVSALGALAHEHRLGAYRLLVETGPAGMNAGAIATRLKLPPSSLTFHLQNLQRAGLITQERKSRELIYAADFSVMNGLGGCLTEKSCSGSPSDCGVTVCAPAPQATTTRKKRSTQAA